MKYSKLNLSVAEMKWPNGIKQVTWEIRFCGLQGVSGDTGLNGHSFSTGEVLGERSAGLAASPSLHEPRPRGAIRATVNDTDCT